MFPFLLYHGIQVGIICTFDKWHEFLVFLFGIVCTYYYYYYYKFDNSK